MKDFIPDNPPTTELIYGGTFDPPHLGHLALICQLTQLYPEAPIRLLPCALPPIKGQAQACFEDRVAMLNLMLKSCLSEPAQVFVDQREANRERPSYSVETLKELHQENPKYRRIWVMGSDAASQLADWWQSQELKNYCHLLVFNRVGYPCDRARKALETVGFSVADDLQACAQQAGCYQFFEAFEAPQSSTRVRQAIKQNESTDELLAASVIKYIAQRQLYN